MAAQTISLLKNVNPPTYLVNPAFDYPGIVWNGKYYFTGKNDDNIGSELWVSDGTSGGTTLLKEINPGFNDSYCKNFTVVNNMLFFTAQTNDNGFELWKTDGTEAGTVMVKDIFAGSDNGCLVIPATKDPFYVGLNNKLYFPAFDGTNSPLWVSDGSDLGTKSIKSLIMLPSIDPIYINEMISFNNNLYFTCYIDGIGSKLWKSDGTDAGTSVIDNGGVVSYPKNLTVVNGRLIFSATTNNEGNELWTTDGTNAGTKILKDIHPGIYDGFYLNALVYDKRIYVIGNQAYFAATDHLHGTELWRTDGTNVGTIMIKDVSPDMVFGFPPQCFSNIGNTLFYKYDDGVNGEELWQSDGTSNGTKLVKDIFSGSNSGLQPICTLLSHNGNIYFAGKSDNTTGVELFTSSGSASGTKLVADINLGALNSNPIGFKSFGNDLLFFATGSDGKAGLYKLTPSAPAILTASGNITGIIKCHGDKTVTLSAVAEGGTTPYAFAWSSGQTVDIISNIGAGSYSVIVTDATGSTANYSFNVTEPTLLTATSASTPSIIGQSNGTATVTPTGGTPPYSYAWTPNTLPNTANVTGLSGGTYKVVITDFNGCSNSQTIVVNEIVATNNLEAQKINIFPNPATKSFQINIPEAFGLCRVEVFDALMRSVFSEKKSKTVSVEVENWTSGVYFVRIQSLENVAASSWKTMLIER
jgi:ELWxxDGT repeat protein